MTNFRESVDFNGLNITATFDSAISFGWYLYVTYFTLCLFLVRRGVTNKNSESVTYLIFAFWILLASQYVSSLTARFGAEGRLCSNESEATRGFFGYLFLVFTEVYELLFSVLKWLWSFIYRISQDPSS